MFKKRFNRRIILQIYTSFVFSHTILLFFISPLGVDNESLEPKYKRLSLFHEESLSLRYARDNDSEELARKALEEYYTITVIAIAAKQQKNLTFADQTYFGECLYN